MKSVMLKKLIIQMQQKKIVMIMLPFLLITSTTLVFYFSAKFIGKYEGYLIGFAFYWIFWCLWVPCRVMNKNLSYFFQGSYNKLNKRNILIFIFLSITIIVPFYATFLPSISSIKIPIILLSIPLAIIHGFCEELFWRGFYVKMFGNQFLWSVLIPTLLFALWHFAPQFAMPVEDSISFVIMVIPLGLIYALTTVFTQSAIWTALAHSISGIFAYSGYLSICAYEVILKQ